MSGIANVAFGENARGAQKAFPPVFNHRHNDDASVTPSQPVTAHAKKLILKKTILQSWLSGKVLLFSAKLPPDSNRCLRIKTKLH